MYGKHLSTFCCMECFVRLRRFRHASQVRSRRNGQILAMKCISKKMLARRNHTSYMQAERDIMTKVRRAPALYCHLSRFFSALTTLALFSSLPFLCAALFSTHVLYTFEYKRHKTAIHLLGPGVFRQVVHPFVVALQCAFQTEHKLFLVMEYLPGGELFFHLSKKGLFLEEYAKFYAAEMVLALEFLHGKGIIHR